MGEIENEKEAQVEQAPKVLGFGETIRQAREEQGISLGDMAARSRLSIAQLKAIESENVSQLPAPVYTRAFIRGLAGILELDAAPLEADYTKRFDPQSGKPAPIPQTDPRCELVINNHDKHRGLKILWIFVLLCVCLAGAWYVYTDFFTVRTPVQPIEETIGLSSSQKIENQIKNQEAAATTENNQSAQEAKTDATSSNAATPVSDVSPKSEEPKPEAQLNNAGAAQTANQVTANNAALADQALNGTAANDAQASQEDKLNQAAANTSANQTQVQREAVQSPVVRHHNELELGFTVLEDCWVDIKKPNGDLVYSGIMKSGTSRTIVAPKGSRIVVGKANAISMKVDGKLFNLMKVAKSNIARFTLN